MGLILLRTSIAFHAIAHGLSLLAAPNIAKLLAWTTGSLTILVGLAILVGFLTPLAGAISTVGYLALGFAGIVAVDGNGQSDSSTAFNLAVVSLALILLGPGALSVDARLFGRREIIVP